LFAVVAVALLSVLNSADLQTQGLKALDRQDYRQAEQIFTQLVGNDPKDYTATFNLGLAETGLKNDEKAIQYFKQTLDLSPGLHPAELNLAMLYLRNKRGTEAIPLLESVIKADPGKPKPHQYLAEALASTGRWKEAEPELQWVVQHDPKNAAAQLALGQSLMHQGKLAEAEPVYKQAATLNPAFKSYLLELAVAMIGANRQEAAIPLLSEFPEDPGAREKLGQLYLDGNQPAKAVPEFEAAVQIAPTPANRLALATAYLKNNQKDKAAPILKDALAASPDDYDLQMAVGRVFRDQRNSTEAADHFFAAAKLEPDSAEAWSDLAGSCVLAQMYPQALGALEKLHELNAEKPGHFFLRAIVLDKLRQPKPALANYKRFLELSTGQNPDQEFQARQRAKILQHEVNGR
jgi:tetratricopeptide (TPR) repeat protein